MPHMDGYETSLKIREFMFQKRLPQPIISAVTGHTEQEYVKAVEELIKQQKFYTDGIAQEEKAQKAAQKRSDALAEAAKRGFNIKTGPAAGINYNGIFYV